MGKILVGIEANANCFYNRFVIVQHGELTASDCCGFVQDQGEKAQCAACTWAFFNAELGQIRGEL